MSDELLGDDFNLFWDSDGDWDSPNWERQISVGDIGIDPQNKQVEIPKRIPHVTYKKGRGDWSLTFTMNYSRSDPFHRAVAAAIASGDKIHLAVVDGDDITDAEASIWEANWFLTGPLGASLDEGANIEVEGKCHFDTGDNNDELPTFTQGET